MADILQREEEECNSDFGDAVIWFHKRDQKFSLAKKAEKCLHPNPFLAIFCNQIPLDGAIILDKAYFLSSLGCNANITNSVMILLQRAHILYVEFEFPQSLVFQAWDLSVQTLQ